LRANISKTRGPVALGNEIQRVRVVFKYGFDAGLIEHPMRYGPMFKRPSKKVLRLARAAKGSKLFEAAGVRRLIDAADVQMKAMILVADNCGFGNSDCGTLPLKEIDLESGWAAYHRPKTGIFRRCALWPETVTALRAAITAKPKPRGQEVEPLVFVTKYGAAWSKESADNTITKEFRKLLDDLGLHKDGLGFYTLHHVFRTVASGAKDLEATRVIMGHVNEQVEDAYIWVEAFDQNRLRAVTEHVRAWLFPPEEKKATRTDARQSISSPAKAKPATKAARHSVAEAPLLRIVGAQGK
jgi:hypothetical protein